MFPHPSPWTARVREAACPAAGRSALVQLQVPAPPPSPPPPYSDSPQLHH